MVLAATFGHKNSSILKKVIEEFYWRQAVIWRRLKLKRNYCLAMCPPTGFCGG